jgi:hypothetical protein
MTSTTKIPAQRRRMVNALAAVGLAVALGTGAIALAGAASAATNTSPNHTDGGKCTVSSGPNKGKTGTFTTEEGTGSSWCEGSWGGTECGTNKCSAKAVAVMSRSGPARPY